MKKVYFPNLNGLRFIAALIVIIHHIEQLKFMFGLPNYWNMPAIKILGNLGVVLFFVLSGFLITYLLLLEQQTIGTISIKNFYIRRILRIWGLYYLIVIPSLFIFPQTNFFTIPGWSELVNQNLTFKSILFILFLPNLALVLFLPVPFASQTWSIGVEEQFYLIQPLIVKKFKNLPKILLIIAISYFIIKLLLPIIEIFVSNYYLETFTKFWQTLNFDCFAIGGIAAVILFKKHPILNFLYSKLVQTILILLTIGLILNGIDFPLIQQEFYSILFAGIILNLASNSDRGIINLENPILNYLGKISYGLYMYHGLAIVSVIKILGHFEITYSILIYSCSLILTILVSAISYHLVEKKLIAQNSSFSQVKRDISVTKPIDVAISQNS